MKYSLLGHTDLRVSHIAMGCWGIVGGFNWGAQDESDSIAALRSAWDTGINFFDTAEAYGDGHSELLIAKALKSQRKELVIASKVSPQNYMPDKLRQSCEASLKRLQTDYIDLYQLHWPDPDNVWEDAIEVLQQLQQAGKIRYYGVSNFGVKDLSTAINNGFKPVTNQMAYNLLFRAIEWEILPLCQQHDIPILCYSPLMQGMLTGKFTHADEVPEDRARTRHFASSRSHARHNEKGVESDAFETIDQLKIYAEKIEVSMADMSLAWILNQPGVGAVIVGARNKQQIELNVSASQMVLDEKMLQDLDELTTALKHKLGSNADMWQTESRIR